MFPMDSIPNTDIVDLTKLLTPEQLLHFERWAPGLPVPWQADPSKRHVVFYHDARRWALVWNRSVATRRELEDT